MSLRTRCGLGIAVAAVLFAAMLLISDGGRHYRRNFITMGTRAAFVFYAPDTRCLAADRAAENAFAQVSDCCNLYDPASELSRLNKSAADAPFVCSDLLWSILCEARKAYIYSEKSFDISIKPLMDVWGFYRKRKTLPPSAEIAAAKKLCGLEKVIFDDHKKSVFFTVKGMALDLGGIAKGRALDLACRAAKNSGIKHGVIDLGGNLALLSPIPPEKSFKIAITDPADPEKIRILDKTLQSSGNCGVSTSGSYERFIIFDGKRYGHIIDPLTGTASSNRHAVTVIAPTAMDADWLSTTLYLRPDLQKKLETIYSDKLHITIVAP